MKQAALHAGTSSRTTAHASSHSVNTGRPQSRTDLWYISKAFQADKGPAALCKEARVERCQPQQAEHVLSPQHVLIPARHCSFTEDTRAGCPLGWQPPQPALPCC